MDLRQLTPNLAVTPQISTDDVADLARAGFKVLINNRPDAEVGPAEDSTAMREAAQAAGMEYHHIPFTPGQMTPDMVDQFADATRAGKGPAVAYCRSGTRSTTLWAMTQSGRRPVDEILKMSAGAGYDLSKMAPLLGKQRG
ncbi:TIGR01244 family phosphatase [Paracoccus sp. Z118]|uniref:TIGR01244 family sulfur transferase n=1 Tax=Paracoccus sp. Z118 TaxID=2851017 RepID=UPI001C2C2E02|nr:TIGR01244 family sulfur transferase [Paracoccus sp. Z118]MBV0893228.1 TIGR01244 family phosphatase [Paracoccus sp. Z118]